LVFAAELCECGSLIAKAGPTPTDVIKSSRTIARSCGFIYGKTFFSAMVSYERSVMIYHAEVGHDKKLDVLVVTVVVVVVSCGRITTHNPVGFGQMKFL